MNLLLLVWSYLRAKPLNTVLNILLLSLGIAVITVLLLFNNQLKEKIGDNTKGIDLVVGAKGSPLQLILCSIFHIDFPTGNIKLKEAERLSKNRLIKKAIPMALGDSYQSFRIVGTQRAYAELYGGELANGNWWQKDLEVTVGATAASLLHLHMGDTFASSHGLTTDGHTHEDNRYKVTGILKPTNSVIDNLILTNVSSVWHVHEEHDDHEAAEHHSEEVHEIKNPSRLVPGADASDSTKEITSLLIKYKNPIAAIQLPRFINSQSNMQAASPAFETARLFTIIGVGVEVLKGFAFILLFISALSLFIALYNSLKERQYDLAIMRSMGATRSKLMISVLLEGSFLTLTGSVAGIAAGHGAVWLFTVLVEQSQKAGITAGVFYAEEGFILLGSVLLGMICSLLPAWQAYKTDIHKVLAG
jgi:putative ABC transport system permease protein